MAFDFGRNWRDFLDHTDVDAGARNMEQSLRDFLGEERVRAKTFLDIGCGTGLASLAALRLGAAKVTGIDVSENSVRCAEDVRARFGYGPERWDVRHGSVLDAAFVESLPVSDVVYAWGVLHHTGDMWKALQHATLPVAPGGSLFVSIYNDQGARSKAWRMLKRIYCSGLAGRWFVTALGSAYFFLVCLKEDLLRFRDPTRRYREYRKNRGMSVLHDWIDWFGGYPFEVAKVDQIFQFYHSRGFELTNLVSVGGALGCNEFVFRRE